MRFVTVVCAGLILCPMAGAAQAVQGSAESGGRPSSTRPSREMRGAPEENRFQSATASVARFRPDPLLPDRKSLVLDRLMPSGVRVIWTCSLSESELRFP